MLIPIINKKIEDITEYDLQSLIDNNVSEGKTLDYKRELPKKIPEGNIEFLKDVTAFANASGGVLIYGIAEDRDTRMPGELIGLDDKNIDAEKTRLHSILRTGVAPRILNVTMRDIPLTKGKGDRALLIVVPRSWSGPHMVVKENKFFIRTSSQKDPMNVEELRVAFNMSETLTERARNFRIDRIARITSDEMPVILDAPHRIVLHLIPANAFNPFVKYDINSIYNSADWAKKLPVIRRETYSRKYNLDGLLTHTSLNCGKAGGYTQLYRNGIIEAVASDMVLSASNSFPCRIPWDEFKKELKKAANKYQQLMPELNIEPPIFVFLTLLNLKDFKIAYGQSPCLYSVGSIDRDMLLLPCEVIEEYGTDDEIILKPMFDLIWNACGEPSAP